jgi:hypothetical protein
MHYLGMIIVFKFANQITLNLDENILKNIFIYPYFG